MHNGKTRVGEVGGISVQDGKSPVVRGWWSGNSSVQNGKLPVGYKI